MKQELKITSKPVRVGVIGAGGMGSNTMLNIMAGHPAVHPVAFYETAPTRPENVERIAKLTQAGIRQCASMDELLARGDIDIILNCTPHYAHAETSIAAMRAGHAVLCEKPPACSPDQCKAMLEVSRETGKPLLIHFQHMLRPSARWLKQAVCRGDLGRIRRVRCVSLWWRTDAYYSRVDWSGKRLFQGQPTLDGAMTNQTSHFLNQMLAMGQRTGLSHVALPDAKTMRSALYRFRPDDVLEMEDTAIVVGVLDNEDRTEFAFAGTTCAAEAEITDRTKEYGGTSVKRHIVTIEGDCGTATWDGGAHIELDGRSPLTFNEPDGQWPFYFHLQNVLAGKEEPITPAEQSCNTMQFIFAAYHTGRDEIMVRPWSQHVDVAAMLRRCHKDMCLPQELSQPPKWA